MVIFLQAHSHVKKLLSNAPAESVVRVTGIVCPRPPGQENPVRRMGSQGFFPCGKEHCIVGVWWVFCRSFAMGSSGEIIVVTCNLGELQRTLDTHKLNCIPAL